MTDLTECNDKGWAKNLPFLFTPLLTLPTWGECYKAAQKKCLSQLGKIKDRAVRINSFFFVCHTFATKGYMSHRTFMSYFRLKFSKSINNE